MSQELWNRIADLAEESDISHAMLSFAAMIRLRHAGIEPKDHTDHIQKLIVRLLRELDSVEDDFDGASFEGMSLLEAQRRWIYQQLGSMPYPSSDLNEEDNATSLSIAFASLAQDVLANAMGIGPNDVTDAGHAELFESATTAVESWRAAIRRGRKIKPELN